MKPIAFIDVDGVLNVLNFRKAMKPGMTQQEMTLSNGQTYPIRLRAEFHAALLQELEDAGFELVWGTTWEDDANRLIAPELGLSRWPVAMVEAAYAGAVPIPPLLKDLTGFNWKAAGVLAYAGDRPFIWIDDDLWEPDYTWARRRTKVVPTKLIRTNAKEGLMSHHIRKAKEWLADIES